MDDAAVEDEVRPSEPTCPNTGVTALIVHCMGLTRDRARAVLGTEVVQRGDASAHVPEEKLAHEPRILARTDSSILAHASFVGAMIVWTGAISRGSSSRSPVKVSASQSIVKPASCAQRQKAEAMRSPALRSLDGPPSSLLAGAGSGVILTTSGSLAMSRTILVFGVRPSTSRPSSSDERASSSTSSVS